MALSLALCLWDAEVSPGWARTEIPFRAGIPYRTVRIFSLVDVVYLVQSVLQLVQAYEDAEGNMICVMLHVLQLSQKYSFYAGGR